MLPSAMRRTQSSQTFRTDPDLDPGPGVQVRQGHQVHQVHQVHYPGGFEPLRSDCRASVSLTSCPIIRNPFVSPLLAPSDLLRGLPPVHIVVGPGPGPPPPRLLRDRDPALPPQASALDALLDDSVMFARKLRAMGQPVSLTVVEDLPHGFLSLAQLAKETQVASSVCLEQLRLIFQRGSLEGSGGGGSTSP